MEVNKKLSVCMHDLVSFHSLFMLLFLDSTHSLLLLTRSTLYFNNPLHCFFRSEFLVCESAYAPYLFSHSGADSFMFNAVWWAVVTDQKMCTYIRSFQGVIYFFETKWLFLYFQNFQHISFCSMMVIVRVFSKLIVCPVSVFRWMRADMLSPFYIH